MKPPPHAWAILDYCVVTWGTIMLSDMETTQVTFEHNKHGHTHTKSMGAAAERVLELSDYVFWMCQGG